MVIFMQFTLSLSSDEFRDFMEVEMEFVGRDEDGDPDYEYDWENAEVDTDAILAYATDKVNSEGTGKGMYDWGKRQDHIA